MSIVIGFISYFLIFKASIRFQKTDLWIIVVNLLTNKRELTPLDMDFTNTLIWLHDYNE